MKQPLPNILLISDDEHNAECLGCAERREVKTPNLDDMARHGVQFHRAYSSGPESATSRLSFLTGTYPHTHGVYNYSSDQFYVKTSLRTLAQHLRDEAGYRCVALGNLYYGRWDDDGFERTIKSDEYVAFLKEQGLDPDRGKREQTWATYMSYDSEIPYELSDPIWLANQAIQVIEELAGQGQPFFLWVDHQRPHPPIRVPYDCPFKYDPHSLKLPPTTFGDYIKKPGAPRGGIENIWNIVETGEELLREALARYYACISMVDDATGRVIRRLKELGLLERTIVIFTADHGDFAGEYGQIGKCALGCFEPLHRVPLIWYWPGHFGHQSTYSLVENIDIFPTLCELIDLPIPPQVQGESYGSYLKHSILTDGAAFEGKRRIFFDTSMWKAVRTHSYKFVYHYDGEETMELYNLLDDPLEKVNLADRAEWRDVREGFLRTLLQWLISTEQPTGWSAVYKKNPPSRWYRENPAWRGKKFRASQFIRE